MNIDDPVRRYGSAKCCGDLIGTNTNVGSIENLRAGLVTRISRGHPRRRNIAVAIGERDRASVIPHDVGDD